jgi:hypothetical protein
MIPPLIVTTQAVIASEAKQSPSRKEEIASSQKTLLAMTRAEQLPLILSACEKGLGAVALISLTYIKREKQADLRLVQANADDRFP